MKLTSFRIRNYKSIRDSGECDLSLEYITILAGQNESGKTSILEALRDFDYPAAINPEAHPDDDEDAKPIIDCTFTFTKTNLEELQADKKRYELASAAKASLLKIGKITLRKSSVEGYSIVDKEILDVLEKHPIREIGEPKPVAAAQDDSKEQELTHLEPENISRVIATALMLRTPYMIYFDSFNGHLPRKKYLSEIDDGEGAGYQAVQDFIQLSGIDVKRLTADTDAKKLGNYLESKSATVTGDFLSYWSQKYDGENQVEIVTELNRDDKGPFLSFYVRDKGLRKYPEQRSKGFLWFLSFYLRLNAESVDTGNLGAVVLIDEPGSYLHQRAQKDILKVLQEKLVKAKHQVIFSRHSSDLIDPERINRVRLVLNKKGKGTMIHKLTDPVARENGASEFADALSPIVAAIGKDLSRDFSVVATKNVLVEGISDFYYLTTLRDKAGFKIPKDVRIIPMTGALSISHMVSIMTGWGLEYVVVMDRDQLSKAAYEKLVDELDVAPQKIFRIEGGKAIEDLFSEKDFKKYVLNDEQAVWPSGQHQSDFVRSEKVILSRQFREKYKDATLTLEPTTKINFAKITQFIRDYFE